MAIMKVDPIREFAVMQDRLNRLFGNVYLRDEDTGFRGSWVPSVDIFETGAILLYLAEKSGQLMPADIRGRYRVTQWLMWQMSALGPIGGQNGHFKLYAQEKIPYAIDRFGKEMDRLYGVMDRRLAQSEYLAGAYSITARLQHQPASSRATAVATIVERSPRRRSSACQRW